MRKRSIGPLKSGISESAADTWPALDKGEKRGNLCMKSGVKRHDIAKIAVEKGERASLRGIRPGRLGQSSSRGLLRMSSKLPSPYDEDKRFTCTPTWHGCQPCNLLERDTQKRVRTTDRTARLKSTRNASCMCPSKGSD
jgi:hypothetical protein